MIRALVAVAVASLRARWGPALLASFSVALAAALLVSIDLGREAVRRAFAGAVGAVDLVVGPPSGDIELVLASVLGIGKPRGVIPGAHLDALQSDPRVAWAIPWLLGDSVAGVRVVGTDVGFFSAEVLGSGRSLGFAVGRPFAAANEVVLGAEASQRLGQTTGARIVVAHGLGQGALVEHEADPVVVVGVLEPSGTAFDRAVYMPLEGLMALHEDPGGAGDAVGAEQAATLSAVLVGLTSRLDLLRVREEVGKSGIAAVAPGLALGELWRAVGLFERALVVLAGAVAVVAALCAAVALVASLSERRHELAVLRALGVGPVAIALLLAGEAALVATAGVLAGLLGGPMVLLALAKPLQQQFGVEMVVGLPSPSAFGLLAGVWVMTILASLPVAVVAARRALSSGLAPRT